MVVNLRPIQAFPAVMRLHLARQAAVESELAMLDRRGPTSLRFSEWNTGLSPAHTARLDTLAAVEAPVLQGRVRTEARALLRTLLALLLCTVPAEVVAEV